MCEGKNWSYIIHEGSWGLFFYYNIWLPYKRFKKSTSKLRHLQLKSSLSRSFRFARLGGRKPESQQTGQKRCIYSGLPSLYPLSRSSNYVWSPKHHILFFDFYFLHLRKLPLAFRRWWLSCEKHSFLQMGFDFFAVFMLRDRERRVLVSSSQHKVFLILIFFITS